MTHHVLDLLVGLDALKAHDPHAARNAMRRHLRGVVDDLLEATELEAMQRALVATVVIGIVAPVVGGANAQRLIDAVLGIERLASVRELRPFLQRA